MKKIWISLIAVVLVVGLGWFFLGKQEDKKQETVKIGAILPLTGGSSYLGEGEKQGVEIVKQLLGDKNKNVVVIYEDGANDAKTSLSAFQKLVNIDKVQGVIVAHSGVNGPISDYIAAQSVEQQKKLPLPIGIIVASTKITQNNNIYLRCYPSGIDEASSMAKFAIENLKIKTASIIYQNDDYGLDALQQFNSYFSGNNGKIVYTEAFDKSLTDQRNVVTKIISTPVDALYIVGNTPGFSSVIRQVRQSGFKGVILSGSGLDVASIRLSIGEDALQNVYYTSTFTDSPELEQQQKYKEFKDALKEKGATPNMLNVYAAIAFDLLYQSFSNNVGKNTIEMANDISKQKFTSIVGEISFNSNRDAILPLFIKRTYSVNFENDELLYTDKK
jgi:branched-chain amino acid transport system substrate-binding protein